MKREPGHIEFWGYPGSGKTTLSRMLSASGVCVADTRWRGVAASPFITGRLLACEPLLRSALGRSDGAAQSLASVALRQSVAFAAARQTPAIVQEGVVHEIWRILYRHPEEAQRSWWNAYLKYAGPTVLVLDISPEHALNRIRTKTNQGPVNRELATSADGDAWSRATAAYAALLAAITEREELRILKVPVLDSEGPEIVLPRLLAAMSSAKTR